jgi:hypothetical protein
MTIGTSRQALLILLSSFVLACGPPIYIPANEPHPAGPPPQGVARIYFVLPQGAFIPASSTIFHNDKLIGFVKNQQFFVYEVPAGKHWFVSFGSGYGNVEGLVGTFQGGKTYYIKVIAAPGYQVNRAYWAPLEPETDYWNSRLEWLDSCEFVKLNPAVAGRVQQQRRPQAQEFLGKFQSGELKPVVVSPHFCE